MESPDKEDDAKEKARKRGQTLPTTDVDMINAGTSFLDAIEKSLGLRYAVRKTLDCFAVFSSSFG